MPTCDTLSCPQFLPEQLGLANATPVGSGAVSQVVQSRLRRSQLPIAVKIMSKLQLLQQQKVASALNEKKALLLLAPHPFIARLYGTGQSDDELYFVMEWLPHGDLLQHIRKTATQRVKTYSTKHSPFVASSAHQQIVSTAAGESKVKECGELLVPIPASSTALRCFDYHDLQLITAQLIMGLSRTFEKGLVLRDLKPENVAFDEKYRACLIDFDTVDLDGSSFLPSTGSHVGHPPQTSLSPTASQPDRQRRLTVSDIGKMRMRTASFCGTAQYVSPEMVGACSWSFSSDLWALGAVVYEMLYGVHMFAGESAYDVMKKVLQQAGGQRTVPFPIVDLDGGKGEAFDRVKDFILRLVDPDPAHRLGVHQSTHEFDLNALQQHLFLRDFDWAVLEEQVRAFHPRTFITAPEDSDGTATFNVEAKDTSKSLLSFYHTVPESDPDYAEYVYQATADANPFERYLKQILLHGDTENSEESKKPLSPTCSSATLSSGQEEEDDTMDIIDDVGMRYKGNPTHTDFQQD